MRRTFLFQISAVGLSLLFGRRGSRANSLNQLQSKGNGNDILGKWHLLDEAADENNIPDHRMDLLFKIDIGQLRGAILNRNTGEEIPLAEVKFDGSTLQLQMRAPTGTDQAAMPTLMMTKSNDKFEGHWRKSRSEIIGPKLKLVRVKP